MGLRLTEGMNNALCSATLSMDASPSPLSSRPKRRDLQFSGPCLEMFFRRSVPGFSAALETTARSAFIKESRMMFANATKFDRKSGVA